MRSFLFIGNIGFGVANLAMIAVDLTVGVPAIALLNAFAAVVAFFTAFVVGSE